MLQRQPRVGDIVDDYCPRERRVSDHAVVAMVGDDIRQTRCTTCDTEHEYRQGKVPPSRKKPAGALPPKPPAAVASIVSPKPPEPSSEAALPDQDAAAAAAPDAGPAPPPQAAIPDRPMPVHEAHVHRRLIRAVLPRVEGEIPVRQAPEFTMHRTNERPSPHGKGHRPGQGGQPRHGGKGPAVHSQRSGQRSMPGAPSAGGRGRGGFGGAGGPGGPGGHGGHGGPRQGRPHGGGQGQRKKH